MCRHCGHVMDWHGDRAISGCDGGWDRIQAMQRTRRSGDPVALCSCPGWQDDFSA